MCDPSTTDTGTGAGVMNFFANEGCNLDGSNADAAYERISKPRLLLRAALVLELFQELFESFFLLIVRQRNRFLLDFQGCFEIAE